MSTGWTTLDSRARACAITVARSSMCSGAACRGGWCFTRSSRVWCSSPRSESASGRRSRGGERQSPGRDESGGELVCVAEPGCWFAYHYWLDEARRPDFATCVDIHRKPGYDPAELFVDPKIRFPKLKVARVLAKKLAGFRYLMDVIPTDSS